MSELAQKDLQELTEYALDSELHSFQTALLEGSVRPYRGLDPDEWAEAVDDYLHLVRSKSGGAPQLLDWLAVHSEGHVYCCAVRLNHSLIQLEGQ